MAQKQQRAEPKRAALQVPRSEAEARIRERIEKVQSLLELQISNSAELEQARSEKRKWSDFNAALLRRIVDTDELVNDYYPSAGIGFLPLEPVPLATLVKEFHYDVRKYITCLESILDRLELIPESPTLAQPTKEWPIGSYPEVSRRVFVVHGHDEEAKQSAARCLE